MILRRLFKAKPEQAKAVYAAIVAATRQPHFYAKLEVPDTIDGRFDLLVLHLSLVVARLKGEDDILRQQLIDVFCSDMDDNVRELGAGDLGVSKKVRRMAEAFQGRYVAYIAAQDVVAMQEAVKRNIFAGKGSAGVAALAVYALTARNRLSQQQTQDIVAGNFSFT